MADSILLIKEQYFTKVFMGKGDLTSEVPSPKLGYFYVNATTGKAMRYDGSQWKDLGANENITI